MKISIYFLDCFLLFLFAMNFMNFESRIIIILFLYNIIVINKWKFPITKSNLILIVFCIMYFIYYFMYNPKMFTYYMLPYLIGPIAGYSIGFIFINKDVKSNLNNIKILFYCLIFGRFIHGLLNYIISNGYKDYHRNGLDFWTKTTISATFQGALMTMVISLLFYGFFIINKKQIIEKILIISSCIFALLNNLMSASRTAIIIMMIVFVLNCLFNLFNSNKNKLNYFIFIIIVLSICILLYQFDFLHIKTFIEQTPLYERLNNSAYYELGDMNRKNMINSAISSAIYNPFGNGNMDLTAHNLWLDVLKQTGWIPFFLISFFTLNIVRKVLIIIKSRSVAIELKYLLLSTVFGVLINFAVEPIFKGMPYYFVVFCIISGSVDKYFIILEKDKKGKTTYLSYEK